MISKLFNKLFLVKEIKSQENILHFRRWRFFSSPIFRIYVHQICKSDLDKHFHSHPWNFKSFILEGAYSEKSLSVDDDWKTLKEKTFYSFETVNHKAKDYHKIKLISTEVWTLVFAWGFRRDWGYYVDGKWVGHRKYRELKNQGAF